MKEAAAYKSYYEKTGIELTNEIVRPFSPELHKKVEPIQESIFNNPGKAISELKRLIQQYPDVPSLKNYLFVAYQNRGDQNRAEQILDRTIQDHPDYFFGYSNKIMNLQKREEAEKYWEKLGNPSMVKDVFPGEGPIHITELISFESTAAYLDALRGDHQKSTKRLDTLIDLEVHEEKLHSLAIQLAQTRILQMGERHRIREENTLTVESFPTIEYTQTQKPPVFHHPEVQRFYQKDIDKFDEEISAIHQLDRQTLIEDLEKVLIDSIYRWHYFEEMEWTSETHSFSVHALYFLGALKAYKSLPKILNLLRMGEGFNEYWFGDMGPDFFHPTLVILGKDQLPLFKDYVLEENNYAFDRLLVTDAVAQIGIHYPEKRAEAVEWFEQVLQFMLENPNNKNLIDTDFIALAVANTLDMAAIELMPLIEKLYRKGWILDEFQGNIDDMRSKMEKGLDPLYKRPLPENIEEYYTMEYKDRIDNSKLFEGQEQNILNILNKSKGEQLVSEYFSSFLNPFEEEPEESFPPVKQPSAPVARTNPKVGRNDPCPCGSGKKYKKCCWSKDH